jgi:hypothetical protein
MAVFWANIGLLTIALVVSLCWRLWRNSKIRLRSAEKQIWLQALGFRRHGRTSEVTSELSFRVQQNTVFGPVEIPSMLRPPLHMDHQSSRSILYDRDALPDIKSPPKRSLNGALGNGI